MNFDDSARQQLLAALGDRPDALALSDTARVRPVSTEEVATVVAWAVQHTQRLYPTSSGRTASVADGLVLDLSALDSIVEVNREDMLAVAQAGVRVHDLAAAAAGVGLEYPPAFLAGPHETVGSALARGAGSRSRLSGPHRDYALGLRVVFGTGEASAVGSRAIKNQTGYNLTQHIIGSWGAFAVTVEATLRLTPARPARSTCVATFGSVRAAAQASVALAASAAAPELVELIDRPIAEAGDGALARLLGTGDAWLLVHFEGLREAGVTERAEAILADARKAGAASARALGADGGDHAWDSYRSASHLRSATAIRLTLGLPLSAVGKTIDAVGAVAARQGFRAAWCGGVGFGAADLSLDGPADAGARLVVVREIVDLLRSTGGGISSCSGLGLDYDSWLDLLLPAQNLALLRAAKSALDPSGVLRPLLG
jgi:glycolate oxidase